MSIVQLIAGKDTLLVGVEDHGDGGLRLYLGHRARGVYALVYDEDVKQRVRAAWAGNGHVTVAVPPPECVFSEAKS